MLYDPRQRQVKKRWHSNPAPTRLLRRQARREIRAQWAKNKAGAMFTLDELARTIHQRAEAHAESSYTRSLLDKGAAHCARKFGEESIEFIIAAAAQDETAVRAEAADVLYHLLVALRARGVELSSVMDELGRRSKQSGHQEKASRTKSAEP
jgi:phosphoribosyl-ATP pyrophosphohydrolase